MKTIFDMLTGFAYTNVLHSLVSTGIIDKIDKDPKSLHQIAQDCDLNEDVLYRLLRFAIAMGVINLNGDNYNLTESGSLLSKDHPRSMSTAVRLVCSEPWQKSWANVSKSVATGVPAFDETFGDNFFSYLDKHPQYGIPYNKWMTANSASIAPLIVNSYNFSNASTVCDIAGGQGYLLSAILGANPDLKGILFDQDNTISNHFIHEFDNRVTAIAGNFFEKVPSSDIMIMKNIIHDWNDRDALKILDSCKRAMLPDSKLLIIDMIIGEEADVTGYFYDLHMQVLLGGKERTKVEFEDLIKTAGLKMVNIIKTGSPMYIIEVTL